MKSSKYMKSFYKFSAMFIFMFSEYVLWDLIFLQLQL